MELTALFEEWLLGDGCYPPLHRGQLVNLAFQLRPTSLRVGPDELSIFESFGDATCRLIGTVLRVYTPAGETPLAVLEGAGFRCYVEEADVAGYKAGARVVTEGTLSVDYYVWAEFYADRSADQPDLFYPLRVIRIRQVRIPEEFVTRTERSVAYPGAVPLGEVSPEDVEEVDTMEQSRQPSRETSDAQRLATSAPAFFLLDLSDESLPPGPIPRTFQ